MTDNDIGILEEFAKKLKEYKKALKELDDLYIETQKCGEKVGFTDEQIKKYLYGAPPSIGNFPYVKKHKFLLEALAEREMTFQELKTILKDVYKIEGKDGVINTMLQDTQDYGLVVFKRKERKKYFSLTEKGYNVLRLDMSESVRFGEKGEKTTNILEVLDEIEEQAKPKQIWEILKEKGIQYPKKEVATILHGLYQKGRVNSELIGKKRLYSKKSTEK